MSGIVGILHLDRAPVDRPLLERLTDFLVFRGPDAQQVWTAGHVGFGHTLLKTTEEPESEVQPFTLDGHVWIVADARVDARRDLIAALAAKGQAPAACATDVELILRAYLVWGEDCLQHLLGDFTFGIWDAARERLFCARDHLGVKPFYYAHIGSLVIFSNTLDCIRQHHAVSNRLNDLAIADFLLFKCNQEFATTTFADIQRLPPAHHAVWDGSGLSIRRYWTLPIDEPIFYRRPDEYCDRFKELLRETVEDRLRTSRVEMFMSGGLDSTTLAATAHDLLREHCASFSLNASVMAEEKDPEVRFATLAARRLGIPLRVVPVDDSSVDFDWEQVPFRTPEPIERPWARRHFLNWFQSLSQGCRVFFYGEGPDNALTWEWRPYVSYLLRRGEYARLLREAFATLASSRKPPYWTRIQRKFWQWRAGVEARPRPFPAWLNSDLESRLKLRQRWEQRSSRGFDAHPIRPRGYASLQIPLWPALFERLDPGVTNTLIEVRHPMADVRLLRFLLAVPPLPWCREKYLERRSLRGVLPKPVLQRTKFNPSKAEVPARMSRFRTAQIAPAPGFSEYVNPQRLPVDLPADTGAFGLDIKARSLNHRLQNSWTLAQNKGRRSPYNETGSVGESDPSKPETEAIQQATTTGLR